MYFDLKIVIKYVTLNKHNLFKKRFLRISAKTGYHFIFEYIVCSLGKWLKIQYLWWILNNIYCVPDEKDSRVYRLFFMYISFGDEGKKRQNFQLILDLIETSRRMLRTRWEWLKLKQMDLFDSHLSWKGHGFPLLKNEKLFQQNLLEMWI